MEAEDSKAVEEGGEEEVVGEEGEETDAFQPLGEYKIVTSEEEEAKTYSIFDVVLPIPGK